jgi:6-phospho-beta-glucosidase
VRASYIVAVIGAGSTYTPELIDGFIARAERLHMAEYRLMDINPEKLSVVGGLARRMLERSGSTSRFALTEDLDEALRGADFVVCQIRVGGLAARELDEKIPLKYGMIGQETTGLGGFMKTMRTIPALTRIVERMREVAPEAWLVNFTNPSGLMAEFILNDLHFDRAIGLCNVPINMKADIAGLAPPGAKVEIEYVGLNHFSWITKVFFDGREVLGEALRASPEALRGNGATGLVGGRTVGAMKNIPDTDFDPELLRAIGAIPNSYLSYYYNRDRQLAHLREAKLSRAEECMAIERELLDSYRDPELRETPASLEKRGGHLYSEAAVSLIDAIANDSGAVHVVNARNAGALEFMGADDVVEVSCEIGRRGPVPVPVRGFDNEHIIGMMRMMKAYERGAARAGLEGDRDAALSALLLHPLAGDYERTKSALDELLAAHAANLPQFARAAERRDGATRRAAR